MRSAPAARLVAGVTLCDYYSSPNGILAFLHAPARSIGGPAVLNMATVWPATLFASSPYGYSRSRCSRIDATGRRAERLGARELRSRISAIP